MSSLDCQQKIDMGLLGNNENLNRLKFKAWLWSPRHQINKGPIRKMVI